MTDSRTENGLRPRWGLNESKRAALLYLGNLRPSGRRTMTTALEAVARLLCGSPGYRLCPWHEVRNEHLSALRAVLQAKYAPATVNKHLTAVRGVLRECWRQGLMDGDAYRRGHRRAECEGLEHARWAHGVHERAVRPLAGCGRYGAAVRGAAGLAVLRWPAARGGGGA